MACAEELFSAFPQRDFANPEIYVKGVVVTLSRYPEAVVRKVCSVDTGLPQTSKFLPSIAEVREACEREINPRAIEGSIYMRTA